jgi:hypothetical protein
MAALEKWSFLTTEKKEFRISEESAQKELKRLIDYYDVDINETTSEQSAAVDQILSRLQKAIQAGKLELQESEKGLSLILHTKNDNELTFREICGADKAKLSAVGDDPIKRLHYLAGLLCGLGTDVIGKLQVTDLRIVEAISGFFCVLC